MVSSSFRPARQAITHWHQLRARNAQYAMGDRIWLYNPYKKLGLTPKLQSYCEGPTPICNDSRQSTTNWAMTRKRTRIAHVGCLCAAVEEGHFTWSHLRGEWTWLKCAVCVREDSENEAASEPCASRPLNEEKSRNRGHTTFEGTLLPYLLPLLG